MLSLPPTFLCDFYKVSHRIQYPIGTQYVYSTWTPRNSLLKGVNEVVAFGFQAFVKNYLIDFFNNNFFNRPLGTIVEEYARVIKHCLGESDPDCTHIIALWMLNYLPIRIKAVDEGTKVSLRVPMLTIENTLPEFFWLTNYLETLMSCELWLPATSATIAYEYRKILDRWAESTGSDPEFVQFQGHDFSMRGMGCVQSAAASGAGHLLSFVGTDTIPAINYHEHFYGADIEKELIGCSVPATEHAVMSAGGADNEFGTYHRLITEVYPTGIVSIVSDTWDLWHVLTTIIPLLKADILARDGKVVIRPDSGDPVDIICGEDMATYEGDISDFLESVHDSLYDKVSSGTALGKCGPDSITTMFRNEGKVYEVEAKFTWTRFDKRFYYLGGSSIGTPVEVKLAPAQQGVIEILWDIFGGTVNEQGYKVLDPRIGAIYGDSITRDRCAAICSRLASKGFASSNVVFGVGSYTYQYNTRDTFGFALKATHVVIGGVEHNIFKDPVTDSGMKKSQTGRVAVVNDGDGARVIDGLSIAEELTITASGTNLLTEVFCDGTLTKETTLAEIRQLLRA